MSNDKDWKPGGIVYGADRQPPSGQATPAHFTQPTYIGTVGTDAKLIAFGLRVMVVEPNQPPKWITPTGLEVIDCHPPRAT